MIALFPGLLRELSKKLPPNLRIKLTGAGQPIAGAAAQE
jgi:hypothetical protein